MTCASPHCHYHNWYSYTKRRDWREGGGQHPGGQTTQQSTTNEHKQLQQRIPTNIITNNAQAWAWVLEFANGTSVIPTGKRKDKRTRYKADGYFY